jgi:preprotein translocase subunit SecA
MGTERHESRRIDNQLRGRAGRQGDPGKSRFYVSLEDDLMMRFGGDRIQAIMNRMGWEEGTAMDGGLISRSIETAQKRVEDMHFESRKHVTDYDDVMNKQRQVIYALRNKVLHHDGIRDEILAIIEDLIEELVTSVCIMDQKPLDWDLEDLKKKYQFLTNVPLELPEDMQLDVDAIFGIVHEEARSLYLAQVTEKDTRLSGLISLSSGENPKVEFEHSIPSYEQIEQRTLLEGLDHFWNAHIQDMEELRDGIGLRGYAQQNPLYEYQREGFVLFQQMLGQFKEAVARKLYYEEIVHPELIVRAIEEEEARRHKLEMQRHEIHDPTLADASPSEPSAGGNKDR